MVGFNPVIEESSRPVDRVRSGAWGLPHLSLYRLGPLPDLWFYRPGLLPDGNPRSHVRGLSMARKAASPSTDNRSFIRPYLSSEVAPERRFGESRKIRINTRSIPNSTRTSLS